MTKLEILKSMLREYDATRSLAQARGICEYLIKELELREAKNDSSSGITQNA